MQNKSLIILFTIVSVAFYGCGKSKQDLELEAMINQLDYIDYQLSVNTPSDSERIENGIELLKRAYDITDENFSFSYYRKNDHLYFGLFHPSASSSRFLVHDGDCPTCLKRMMKTK